MLAPIYTIAAIASFQFLTFKQAIIFSFPLIVSILIPPIHAPKVLASLSPLATGYFQYEEVLEQSYEEIEVALESGKQRNFLVCMQPHGVVSFTSFCMNIMCPPYHRRVKTVVATSVLYAPILKHLLGINGLISASKANLTKHLKKPGVDGCANLYVGGIAELFKCSREEERLFLSKRKGFIKLALRENVDIVPVYLFGNTSILSEWKSRILCEVSRKTGVVCTYYWGKWALPIPRDEQVLVARGKPMGLPHIPDPSQNDIDYWHAKYCQEVKRLFDTYKEKLPNYKNKKLYID
jgi:2-acylglycerol O-acyltransferase 2